MRMWRTTLKIYHDYSLRHAAVWLTYYVWYYLVYFTKFRIWGRIKRLCWNPPGQVVSYASREALEADLLARGYHRIEKGDGRVEFHQKDPAGT